MRRGARPCFVDLLVPGRRQYERCHPGDGTRDFAKDVAAFFGDLDERGAVCAHRRPAYRAAKTLELDAETLRLVEKTWKGFVKAGAKLDAAGKARLSALNEELSSLGTQFGQNVLADEKDWVLFLDEGDLAGLPDFLKSAMAEAAETRGQPGAYAVTLSRSIYEPFTTFSERRDLREKAFRAFIGRGESGGATDNSDGRGENAVAARRKGEARRL